VAFARLSPPLRFGRNNPVRDVSLVRQSSRAAVEQLAKQPDNLAKTDERLDGGLGACWLKDSTIAALIENAMLHFDGERYRMLAWCVMPNHVHAVLEPIKGNRLGTIVQTWKSFSAKKANSVLDRSGPFWHKDYFDRFIRDEGHLARTVEYVERNPVKAGLASTPSAWLWSSNRRRA
jgi:REP element-mobilizing transposase RayT